MFDLDYWQEIWITITRNKVRSILTGFGVFWGIFMLVILIGVGNSFVGGLKTITNGLSPNAVYFYTGLTSEPYKGYRKGRSWTMKNTDLRLIRENTKSIEYLSPILFQFAQSQNVVHGRKSGSYSLKGIYPDFFQIQSASIVYGRLINEIDVTDNRKVCVIGKEVYETLFEKDENPLGQYIRADGIYFQVVGVVNSSEKISIGSNINQTIHLPFRTMQIAYSRGDSFDLLGCTTKRGYPAEYAENEVKTILRKAHDIAPTDDKAVGSFNAERIFNIFAALFAGVDILVFFVGIGALLSGIIGISNIMLVTVRERTREIGVRRALGAKPFTIVKQVVSESFLLTSIAGLLGFLLGVAVLQIAHDMMVNQTIEVKLFIPPFISFGSAMMSMSILVVSGVLAGLMPAFRALNIKAIDAIREE